jgi:mono/diheme cytochrome c family protein
MNTRLRNIALISAIPILFGIALATAKVATAPVQKWTKVEADLPVSQVFFPPGNGADIANAQCLVCHSAGMVLRQPPLSQEEWTGEINKMRSAFGAPMPADQVEALAKYLHGINGRQSGAGPSVLDGQGS